MRWNTLSWLQKRIDKNLKAYAEKSGMLAKLKFDISGDGLEKDLQRLFRKVAEPQFEGQTKTKLETLTLWGS